MAEKTEKLEEKKAFFKSRDVLWILVFLGFGINYMIRINLNIAIVSMVKHRPRTNTTVSSECVEMEILKKSLADNATLATLSSILTDEGEFDWDEHEQGVILASFYYLHWLTQIPGGILAQKYGTKLVFGLSNLLGVLLCFLIPMASYMGYKYLIIIRLLQGFITGFSWPAMHNMTARWIPPNERSKFVTAYLGNSFGSAITFIMCGYIITKWGWEPVFHVCGFIGCAWYAAWHILVFDSPAEHPRISSVERDYIQKSLGRSISKERKPTPWRSILMSLPVWLNVGAQFGGIWGLITALTHAPMYFKVIHGWNMRDTGFLSGLPHFLRVAWAYLFSQFGDRMLTQKKLSRTNVRKLATFFSCVFNGFCILALAYSGCNYTAGIVLLSLAVGSHGAVSTGSLASLVDLSPNYASILLGISGMLSVLPGFFSPAIVGYLTYNNQSVGQWQKVFWVCAFMLIAPGIFYILFAKSELQPWNDPPSKPDVAVEEELIDLKKYEDSDDKIEKKTGDNAIEN